MSYKQLKLFVKPSSTYPYEKVNDYFISYLNKQQEREDAYLIGDLFNARENELWAIFSDKTRDGHNMTANAISILMAKRINEDIEFLKTDGLKPLNLSSQALQEIKNVSVANIKEQVSVQQLYNDVKAETMHDLAERLPQVQDACGLFLAQHLVQDATFMQKVVSLVAERVNV